MRKHERLLQILGVLTLASVVTLITYRVDPSTSSHGVEHEYEVVPAIAAGDKGKHVDIDSTGMLLGQEVLAIGLPLGFRY